jgi:hypothetical protein
MALDRSVAEEVAVSSILDNFESVSLARAAAVIIEAWSADGNCDGTLDRIPTVIAERIVASSLGDRALGEGDRKQIARDCLRRIEQRSRKARSRSAVARLREIEAGGDAGELRKELERSIILLRQREVTRE